MCVLYAIGVQSVKGGLEPQFANCRSARYRHIAFYGISTVTLKKRWSELVGYCHQLRTFRRVYNLDSSQQESRGTGLVGDRQLSRGLAPLLKVDDDPAPSSATY